MWLTNYLKSFINKTKGYSGFISGRLPVNAQQWDGSNFLTALEVSLYTNKAIGKRADKVGEIEFLLQDNNGKEIKGDKMFELLYKPNKLFTGRQFWSLYQKYLDAIGEVYILLEREREIFSTSKITGMHLLNPTCVTPHFDAFGNPTKYEYQNGSGTVVYLPKQILYVHNPDPKRPLRGQSLLKSGVTAIQTEIQIATYHSRVLENGGKVEGVFKFKSDRGLSEEQLIGIKSKYQKEYGSAKKSGMPLFMGGDAEYTRTGLTPDELSYLEAKKMTLEDICILTGVPRSMLASTNEVKFDNADADRAIFLRETIKPLLTTLSTALDEVLFPDGRNLTFVDPTPENIDQKIKETESGVKNYYMTINEARERHGLDPVTDGDDILVPFNLMPLGTEVKDSTGTDGQKKIKKSDKEIEHPLRDFDTRRLYWNIQIKRMNNREKKFKTVLSEYLKDQEARLINALEPSKTRVFRKKGLFDELLSIGLEVKIGKEMFVPVVTELLKQAGIDAMEFAGSDYDFHVSGNINSWIEQRTDIFLNTINATTFETLRNQFSESLANGESRDKLVNRIQDTYGDISKARAATIARTEVHNATQYGTVEGYKQAGLNTKIWVAVMDSATRDSHASVDGEERPMDIPFSNGLMYPGDPRGSAEDVINCRCVV